MSQAGTLRATQGKPMAQRLGPYEQKDLKPHCTNGQVTHPSNRHQPGRRSGAPLATHVPSPVQKKDRGEKEEKESPKSNWRGQ